MRFSGLADVRLAGTELGEVIDVFVRREDVERALAEVLADEPSWAEELRVVKIPLSPALSRL